MGRSLSPLLRQELANLDKDADSRRSAMKALKSYAKDLDSRAIPHFLAEVSDTTGASFGECTISLYEVMARVHGRNIVPHIENIMSIIIRTLSSSGGSFCLHQACSKVAPAIARYVIDPSASDNEKTKIICSLCKPLSDALMSTQESSASGAAFCLKALVESGNWRFAPDEMVNEVCLKVARALEDKVTQTNAHMGIAMALAKHNGLIAEAYARSLVLSGLQILATGAVEGNSQKRFSAIQMINFLMKCVDPRSISSEIFEIADVMEKCQADDKMAFVKGAAFEALQTAKALTLQKGSRYEISSSPLVNSYFRRRNSKSPWRSPRDGSSVQLCSPESHTIGSCISGDEFTDSPSSVGQSSCMVEHNHRANRRLWNNDGCAVDISLKDGLFLKACSDSDNKVINFEQIIKVIPSDSKNDRSDAFSGFMHDSYSDIARDSTPSPQRSTHLTVDDIKIHTTPRKLIRSLQGSIDNNSEYPTSQTTSMPTTVQTKPTGAIDIDGQSRNVDSETLGRTSDEKEMIERLENQEDAEQVHHGTESVSSCDHAPESIMYEVLHGTKSEDIIAVLPKSRGCRKIGIAVLGFFCGAFVVLVAAIFSRMMSDNDELLFDLVPT